MIHHWKTPEHLLREFRVIGHTDSSGSDEYNLALSESRTLAVRDYLRALPILKDTTISAEGRKETEPIVDNTSAEGRSMNRRVEIIGN
ncbi:OmpA family protein [Roseovarius sp. ZX-A-9]|uniref:OmpA family protein n=1 Tax=Roseovarius sp. ZX-A-9 TaxID=3014783 RepID=UPI00232E02DD|nr:OmpA family protein [Roseovarius sp. ZX-A-9]